MLGAGNTAMDVARTARRLGLRAVCVDWVDERFALARPDELDEARLKAWRSGSCAQWPARRQTAAGRFARRAGADPARTVPTSGPEPHDGDHRVVDAQLVVMAMGYRTDPAFATTLPGTPRAREAKGSPTGAGWPAASLPTQRRSSRTTSRSAGWLWAGTPGSPPLRCHSRHGCGRPATPLVGPSTVVEAMAQGRRAAEAVLASRPGRGPRPEPRRVLVAYESQRRPDRAAARLVADGLRTHRRGRAGGPASPGRDRRTSRDRPARIRHVGGRIRGRPGRPSSRTAPGWPTCPGCPAFALRPSAPSRSPRKERSHRCDMRWRAAAWSSWQRASSGRALETSRQRLRACPSDCWSWRGPAGTVSQQREPARLASLNVIRRGG